MSAAAVGLGAAPRADDSNPLLKTSSSTNGRFILVFPGDDGLDSECTGGGELASFSTTRVAAAAYFLV